MTRQERKELQDHIKHDTQDMLMNALSHAFYAHNDREYVSDKAERETLKELRKQFRRVEKLFGYDPGTWSEG